MPLSDDCLGVVALSAATAHAPRGQAFVTPFIGLRHDVVERAVTEITGLRDGSYRQRTATNPLGYVMPEPGHREWLFTADAAEEAALSILDAICRYAVPYLQALTHDLDALRDAAEASADSSTAVGLVRVGVLLVLQGRSEAARRHVDDRLTMMAGQSNAYADEVRRAEASFTRWLRERT